MKMLFPHKGKSGVHLSLNIIQYPTPIILFQNILMNFLPHPFVRESSIMSLKLYNVNSHQLLCKGGHPCQASP